MPVARKNVLHSGFRKEFLPDLDEDLRKRKILALPKSEPGQPSREKRAIQLCADDPAEFIFGGWCRTFDEHDLDNPWKPFPDEPDLREVLAFIHQQAPIACIAKSRQLMVTWMLAAYCVWLARFHPARAIYFQCKTKEDAKTIVFEDDWLTSRCGFIEYAMPAVLWQSRDTTYTQAKSGRLVYPHGSKIVSVPAGAHHLRSKVGSFVVIDEACFMKDFDEAYQGILAMVKGGGRARIVSTARYNTFFGELIEAETMLAA